MGSKSAKQIDQKDLGTLRTWSPLKHAIFRNLWIAAVFSNIGTWMQNAGGQWLMTSMTDSAALIALMQTATSLPVFLVVLPAGALADIVDRRSMLLTTQTWMFLSAAVLSAITLLDLTTPLVLLMLTFSLGLGAAMNQPVWQSVVPYLVPRNELDSAVALNSVAFNIARAVGPALGGLILSFGGPGLVFLLNAFSFLGVILVIYRWDSLKSDRTLPPENVWGAIKIGSRFTRHSPETRLVLVRCVSFIFFASALWALLPVLARDRLQLGSVGFGTLLGCLGGGALIGAFSLPVLRKKTSFNSLVMIGSLIFASVMVGLALIHNPLICYAITIVAGVAWISTMATLNVSIQLTAPGWVKARVLAYYVLAFQGGLAIGSAVWGVSAERFGLTVTLILSASGIISAGVIARNRKITEPRPTETFSQSHWSEPQHSALTDLPSPESGPVLIILEYRIDEDLAPQFMSLMHQFGRTRKRNGAKRWRLYRDLSERDRFLELFVMESWAEHLRQHTRMTPSDRELEHQVKAFNKDSNGPKVSHYISETG